MADNNINEIIDENAALKQQVYAVRQSLMTLQLQLKQKEEIIINSQTDNLRRDEELKQLKQNVEQKCVEEETNQAANLEETINILKARVAELSSELAVKKNYEQHYRKILDEYGNTVTSKLSEYEKLKEEHEIAKKHVANLELAFTDVYEKYDRNKKIIDGCNRNEDTLKQTLTYTKDCISKSEEKYKLFKAFAKEQLEKSNQDLQVMQKKYEAEVQKLQSILKRLEIQNYSLTDSLDQKTKECTNLAALCDELGIGKL